MIIRDMEMPEIIKPDVHVSAYDALLILDIRNKLGMVPAIRVTRWLTGEGLAEAKRFVESL